MGHGLQKKLGIFRARWNNAMCGSFRKIVIFFVHYETLAILDWLRLPERVNFTLALMAYRLLNGMAPI